ncbi:hypothetical protein ABZ820_10840 [Streptomyces diacarni]|uniref:hypothetical protein n=1 Tax=Streptomyces diacarni TaxID=2800381 RepID=UPI0033E39805
MAMLRAILTGAGVRGDGIPSARKAARMHQPGSLNNTQNRAMPASIVPSLLSLGNPRRVESGAKNSFSELIKAKDWST